MNVNPNYIQAHSQSHTESLNTSFASFYKDSSHDVLEHAVSNLHNIAEAGRSDQALYFENGHILPESKSWARTFGKHEYRDLQNLNIFFEKLSAAVDSCHDNKKLLEISKELNPAKEALNKLKNDYQLKYSVEAFKPYEAALSKSIASISSLQASTAIADAVKTRKEEVQKAKNEFDQLKKNISDADQNLQISLDDYKKHIAMNPTETSARAKLRAIFDESKKNLEVATMDMKNFVATWQA